MPIRIIDTTVELLVWSNPLKLQKSKIICPIEQINPPVQNALKQFLKMGELGDFLSTYLLYSDFVSIGFILYLLFSISIYSKC